MQDSNHEHARREVIQTAKAMILGEMDLIAGSRKLCVLQHEIDCSNCELFDPIIGFESETDDYPVGVDRSKYNESYLNELEAKMKEYIDHAKPAVLGSCQRIIDSLS